MNNPCINCPDKIEDKYSLFCDLACGKHTAFVNYRAGIKKVVDYLNSQREGGYNFCVKIYEWNYKLKEWGIDG